MKTIATLTAVVIFFFASSCNNKPEVRLVTELDSAYVLKSEMKSIDLARWSNKFSIAFHSLMNARDSIRSKQAIDSLKQVHDTIMSKFRDTTLNPIFKKAK